MPRRRNQAESDEVDVTFAIRSNGPVSEYLKNSYFDLLCKTEQQADCPVCMESLLGCRNCFCLLGCGHAMHLHEYLKVNKCPVCRK